jgi:hypothetical protein
VVPSRLEERERGGEERDRKEKEGKGETEREREREREREKERQRQSSNVGTKKFLNLGGGINCCSKKFFLIFGGKQY